MVRADPSDPSPASLGRFFAEVFASLDERPRRLRLTLDVRNDRGAGVSIGLERGEPVFSVDGYASVRTPLRGRWLAEHPVPMAVPKKGLLRLVLEPVDANRVRVRPA